MKKNMRHKDLINAHKHKIVFFLLLVFVVVSITSASQKSTTFDEITYIGSGYHILTTGDYSLNTEHPPLTKLLAGFPLLFMNIENVEYTPDQWEYSKELIYTNNSYLIILLSRIPFILLAALGGWYIFRYSALLFGTRAGILSLFLYVFSPNILAHARLATTDLPIVIFMIMSMYYFTLFLKKKETKHPIFVGMCYGLALASKFTALYFLPLFFVMYALEIFFKEKWKLFETERLIEHVKVCFLILGALLLGFFVFTLTYAFSFDALIKGIAQVIFSANKGRFSYLLGQQYLGGNILYYPVAFITKTPLALFALLAASFFYYKKLKYDAKKVLFLSTAFLLIVLPSLINKINLGLRHILFVYPLLHIYLGNVINWSKKKVLVVILCFYVITSVLVFPHYLTFFNWGVGGPSQGHTYLLDSNLDWGQDGLLLEKYIEKNKIKEITIDYFGNHQFKFEYSISECVPQRGTIAVSVNKRIGFRPFEKACYSWLDEFEPITKLGNTIWIYDIQRDFSQQEIEQNIIAVRQALALEQQMTLPMLETECKKRCTQNCEASGRSYKESGVTNGKCGCSCQN